jgi:TRAP-type uncharacterized transport system fused permease subunit
MIALFTDVSLGLVGGMHAAAQRRSAVISFRASWARFQARASPMSSTTGQFTIPLMKRFGYRPAFAGGVEATASMGGQIMPPVMGAVAFIMAETLVHRILRGGQGGHHPGDPLFRRQPSGWCYLEAGKRGLVGLPKAELPNPWHAVRQHWPLVLPLAALVYLLFAGYTPIFAGTMGSPSLSCSSLAWRSPR